MDDSTSMSLDEDFTNPKLKPSQTELRPSLYNFEPPDPPPASYLDTEGYDDVHPSAKETSTFAPTAAAHGFISDVDIELGHNR